MATPNSAKNASSTAAEKSTIAWPSPTTSWRVLCGDGERDLRAAKAGLFDERARTGLRFSLPTRPEVEGTDESPTLRAAAAAARGADVADAALRVELAPLPLAARLLDSALDIEGAIAEVKEERIEA